MVFQIFRAASAAVAGLLAVLGLVVLPVAVLTTWMVVVVVVGPLITMGLRRAHPAPRAGRGIYATVTAALMTLSAVTVGLAVVTGAAAALILPVLLVPIGMWLWRHRRTVLRRMIPAPQPVRPHEVKAVRDPVPRPVGKVEGPAPRLPHIDVDDLPAPLLCAAWQRTYWLLQDLPAASPERVAVVDLRARLLDELERRDPQGLGRWLHTEPRAGSDPSRYLTGDHRRPPA